jgi:predicted nuclease of predicted toxin-antitoxin system
MRLLLDEHINPEVARQLRRKGFDVLTVEEARMREASDELLLGFAAAEKRAVVTYNICDFQLLLLEWHRAGWHHSGIVFVSGKSISQKTVGPLVRALAKLLETAPSSISRLADQALYLSRFPA